jgi:plasmid stability protein
MSNLTSARLREETPHSSDALKRRAQSIINDKSIEAETRAIIRYGLEINDPWLGDLVRCVDAGESIIDNLYVHSSEEKIEALTGLICRAGDEASAALLVLLSTLENSTHPKALANAAKHLAFTRCGELNVHGMVDAQIATLEGDLLARNAPFP